MVLMYQRPQGRCGNCRHGWILKEAVSSLRCPVCGSPNVAVERVKALAKGQSADDTLLEPRIGSDETLRDPRERAQGSQRLEAPRFAGEDFDPEASAPLAGGGSASVGRAGVSGSILPSEPFEEGAPVIRRSLETPRLSAGQTKPGLKREDKALLPPPKGRSWGLFFVILLVGGGSLALGGWWVYEQSHRGPSGENQRRAKKAGRGSSKAKAESVLPKGCGHPKAKKPKAIPAERWSQFVCRGAEGMAAERWKKCLPKNAYLRKGLQGCPGEDLCCPPP